MKVFTFLCILCFLCSCPAFAQLTPEQALSVRQLSDPHFSPDGSRVAFTVTEPAKGTEQNRDIWVLDTRSGDVLQFTNAPKSDASARWAPTGMKLAFISDRSGTNQIFLFSPAGGDALQLTEGKNAVQSFEWSPDGKRIAFLAPEPKSDADDKKEKDKDDARVVDRDNRPGRLWILEVETKKVRRLTSAPWRISEARWLPDGSGFVVVGTDRPESDQWTNRILSVALADRAVKEITRPRGPFRDIEVSPDGSSIAYIASRSEGPSPHDLYIVSARGGTGRNLTGETIDRPITRFVWQGNSKLLALAEKGFASGFYSVSTTGQTSVMPGFDVHPGAFDVSESGGLVFAGETTSQLPELWLGDLKGAPARRMTRFNQKEPSLALGQSEIFHYKSFDGTDIESLLLTPRGYTAGTRLPFVVMVHGGPTGRWSDRFEPWGQLLATRGYAVLYPNVRGSTGYGNKFVEMNRGDWGGGDFKDVMAGVDAVIARGIADPAKLGIGGWSYGGYMSAWAVTQTNRFKAAVSGAPVIDLASEFGTENGPAYDEWFYGLPYEKQEGFVKSSPITYAKNVRTPTLLLQGEADTTDPIGQSQQFYRALKRYEVDAQLVLYPREGHGLREEKHLLDRLNRVVNWFDSHVK
jgi:dipeptidyl aminopeptidase/acylaminoacyl peptidase